MSDHYPEFFEPAYLTTFFKEQNQKIQFLYTQLNEQTKTISELKNEIAILKESKSEIYYQRFLEKHLGASHKVTKYGITDITTDSQHIEIKQWKHFKACLGQLKSYNHGDNKSLVAAFYGCEYKKKDDVIKLFHENDIHVWELVDTPNGINIEKYEIPFVENNATIDFHTWLDKHIVYKENCVLNLKDVCSSYNKSNLTTKRQKTIYKKEIENWVFKRLKGVNPTCVESRFNNIKFYGWKNLSLI